MPDFNEIARVHIKALIDWFGCLDAAAETLNARWGGEASKGVLSRKMNGSLDWTLKDVVAFEDAIGRYPVTRMMARRLVQADTQSVDCLVAHGGLIAKECGEAVSSILSAQSSSTTHSRADAIKEVDEAIVALKAARSKLHSPTPPTPQGGSAGVE